MTIRLAVLSLDQDQSRDECFNIERLYPKLMIAFLSSLLECATWR